MNNEIIEIQKLLRKQMHRLDEAVAREVVLYRKMPNHT